MNVFKSYGFDKFKNDQFLTLIGSVGALINGLGRIFWGSLLDFYSFKTIFGILIALQYILIVLIQVVDNKWVYLIIVTLSMSCEGACATIIPTATLNIFGMKRGPLLFTFMSLSIAFSAII